ncbi:hypothetical protein [Metabacillus malikii]|uniref:Uncharacterized protein n=1 Tax=Metabacillus malikii TaxID=1504265 RepID=A0ABT9ZHM4_9BACI|nr:hypothetical protein [Metabacillus malikii]MDQ0231792.1 hypothetical protein [Metabacillus malikii]
MKKKTLWLPLSAALFSTGLLYAIGNMFDITYLSWTFYKENPSEGIAFESGGSLIPIMIGFIVGFITEKIMKIKHKDDSNLV